MSAEVLLLLIIFVLLPLIQQLLNSVRQKRPPGPRADQPATERQPVVKPQSATRTPRAPAGPWLPEMAHHGLSDAAAGEGTAPPDAARSRMPASPVRPSARRRIIVAGLRNPVDLRRSIVLMTILGPCRAIDPHEWPERAGRR